LPAILELGLTCQQYRALPVAGGILDQPAGLMKRIRTVMNVFHSYRQHERDGKKAGEMAKWRSDNEDAWQIVSEIEKLRETYG